LWKSALYQIEKIPKAWIPDILDDQVTNEVVGVIAVAAEVGGKESQKFAFLKKKCEIMKS